MYGNLPLRVLTVPRELPREPKAIIGSQAWGQVDGSVAKSPCRFGEGSGIERLPAAEVGAAPPRWGTLRAGAGTAQGTGASPSACRALAGMARPSVNASNVDDAVGVLVPHPLAQRP